MQVTTPSSDTGFCISAPIGILDPASAYASAFVVHIMLVR